MKLCKKETFLYWLIHSVVWIGIALPTLFFLLRINHPQHETEPKPFKLNVTKANDRLTPIFQNCTNYRRHSCPSIAAKRSSSENTSLTIDKEIKTIVNEVFSTNDTSTCKNSLQNMLCLKKYFICNQAKKESSDGYTKLETRLVNVTNKFCDTCYKHFRIKSNTSLKTEIYNWFKNLSCISKLFEEKDKRTPEKNFTCCSYPLVKDENGTCRTPCNWSLMSPSLRDVYYATMVINFWLALITSAITLATLASFRKMREFPHIVRFYILICSALYATSSLLPLRIGLAKVYCGKERFWKEQGHSTTPTVIEGVISHYFFLAFCFWSLCHVFNAYSVIIKQARNIFDKKCKYHFIQFSVCSTLPALFVAINIAVKPPGYKSLFLDRMTSVFTSPVMEYLTFTLPVQIAIGVSVSLLWSVIRFVRKVRKSDTTFQSVRPDKDIRGFINAERQFIKLAILFIATVAVILSSEVVITYRNEEYLHEVEEYFECLKKSNKSCHRPEVQIYFLSSVKICGPGIYCLLNFFLLIFNKDTRGVWRKWLRFGYNILVRSWTEKDPKSSRQGLPTKNGTRARSATLDTNASVNSLNKLSIYTMATALSYKNTNMNTPPTTIRLQSLSTDDEKNNSLTGSVSPKENSPLKVDSDIS